MANAQDYLNSIKKQISEISPDQAQDMIAKNPDIVVLDVREKDEQEKGVLESALLIPRGLLELKIEDALPDKTREVIIYCAGGNRSALAAKTLLELGYSKVHSMIGGYGRWAREGKKTKIQKFLSTEQLDRYARHLLMPEVGEAGQLKLLDAKVLMIGAGGLGSPTAFYLAAAGIGTIGLIDDDVVDRSNLQRQILHTDDRVGVPKVESAKITLKALNPELNVITYKTRLSSENVMDIIKDYDIIVNGCDNFPTRYLINDACVFTKKTLVDASIFRFEGQVSVVQAEQGPCYRCLYPALPPPEMAPSCQEAGVFGMLPGIVGCAQAVEVIKIILNIGEPLIGK